MALRDINLVPAAVLQRRYLSRHAVAWGLAYGLCAAMLVGAYVWSTSGIIARRRAPVREEEVRKRLAATIAEIVSKQEDIERLEFVRDLVSPFGTAEVLSKLAETLDPEAWLTEVSLRLDDRIGGYALAMQGLAVSNARLGATMRALTAEQRFRDVVLRNSSESDRPSDLRNVPAQLVRFSIDAKVSLE